MNHKVIAWCLLFLFILRPAGVGQVAINRYAISGPSFIYVGTGSAGALELLGFTESGCDMDVTENKSEIMTDVLGPMTPQDFQDMGAVARVVCPLIAMDDAVMAKIMMRGDHTGAGVIATAGLINTPGLVLGSGGYGFKVGIASTFDSPWVFAKCITKTYGAKLATKANPFKFEFFAWPYAPFTATTGKDLTLWTRVLA